MCIGGYLLCLAREGGRKWGASSGKNWPGDEQKGKEGLKSQLENLGTGF